MSRGAKELLGYLALAFQLVTLSGLNACSNPFCSPPQMMMPFAELLSECRGLMLLLIPFIFFHSSSCTFCDYALSAAAAAKHVALCPIALLDLRRRRIEENSCSFAVLRKMTSDRQKIEKYKHLQKTALKEMLSWVMFHLRKHQQVFVKPYKK